MGKNREEERRVGSDGVLIATPARTTSTARGTIETRVAGSFGNVAQCLVFLLDAAACPPARVLQQQQRHLTPSFRWLYLLYILESPNLAFVT